MGAIVSQLRVSVFDYFPSDTAIVTIPRVQSTPIGHNDLLMGLPKGMIVISNWSSSSNALEYRRNDSLPTINVIRQNTDIQITIKEPRSGWRRKVSLQQLLNYYQV